MGASFYDSRNVCDSRNIRKELAPMGAPTAVIATK